MKSDSLIPGKIVDLTHFRQKKQLETTIAQGRTPLVVSHLEGKVKDAEKIGVKDSDFGDRILKIRSSLEKINGLMNDLRKMANNQDSAKKDLQPTIERRKNPNRSTIKE